MNGDLAAAARGLARGAVLALAALAVCAGPARAAAERPGLLVAASFPVLADMARRVAGDRADVRSVVPAGGDPHAYDLTPRNMTDLEKAGLIVVNGLGFEGYLGRYLADDKFRGRIVVASAGAATLPGDDGAADPHAWQNPANGAVYAGNIAEGLCGADPGNCASYRENARAYARELAAIDEYYLKAFGALPPGDRVIVTPHEAFGYLGARYGLRIVSPAGTGSGAEPSARRVAEIADLLDRGAVKGVFREKNGNASVLERLAGDRGIASGELYADTLDESGPCSAYAGMLRHNLGAILSAVSPGREVPGPAGRDPEK